MFTTSAKKVTIIYIGRLIGIRDDKKSTHSLLYYEGGS